MVLELDVAHSLSLGTNSEPDEEPNGSSYSDSGSNRPTSGGDSASVLVELGLASVKVEIGSGVSAKGVPRYSACQNVPLAVFFGVGLCSGLALASSSSSCKPPYFTERRLRSDVALNWVIQFVGGWIWVEVMPHTLHRCIQAPAPPTAILEACRGMWRPCGWSDSSPFPKKGQPAT